MQTLKQRRDFQRVQKGKKWVTPAFILHGLSCPDSGGETTGPREPRFGFTVSSKAVAKEGGGGKRRGLAVDRNRARRRLKEAVRLSAPAFASADFDYVVIGRAAALDRKFEALLADMRIAFHKVIVGGNAKAANFGSVAPAGRLAPVQGTRPKPA